MVRLMLSHDRREMGRLAEWLDCQERLLAIPPSVAFAVRLCLEEAVINLIDHTSATGQDLDIAVELDWQGDALVAAVDDRGPPFDLRTAPAIVRPVSLEAAVPGGRGIHLIRSFASEIGYDTAAGRNRLTLRFAPPAARS